MSVSTRRKGCMLGKRSDECGAHSAVSPGCSGEDVPSDQPWQLRSDTCVKVTAMAVVGAGRDTKSEP